MLEARARFNAGIPEVFIRVGQDGDSGDSPYFLCMGSPSRSNGHVTHASLLCGRKVQRRADHEATRQTHAKVAAAALVLIIQASRSKSLPTSHMHQKPIRMMLWADYSGVTR
jgi:hypothetical protein